MTANDDIVSHVSQYCREHNMFNGDSVLVALSGGGDSVALLVLLLELREQFNISVTAAHLNHSLRGVESDRDNSFCSKLCETLHVPLISKRLEPGVIENLDGSIETAARNIRMAFLEETAQNIGAGKIATGHTADDQVETIVQRLLRGTGPAGLAGILPIRDNRWIRPLLGMKRNILREYLQKKSISYCDDTSNDDVTFLRNRIRHKILPMMRDETNGTIDRTIIRLANISQIQESWISQEVNKAFERCCYHLDGYKILLEKNMFISYHILIQQRIVRCCLKHLEGAGRDDDSVEITNILRTLTRKRSTVRVTVAVTAECNECYLAFSRSLNRNIPKPVVCPGTTVLPFEYGLISASIVEKKPSENNTVSSVMLPLTIIERLGTLSAGTIRAGETMAALNKKGTIRIRDLFSDACIPTSFRETIPVIHAGAVPIWIPGLINIADTLNMYGESSDNRCIHLTLESGIQWRSGQTQ
jgi:tRNA(Ile)-lysidine synthase